MMKRLTAVLFTLLLLLTVTGCSAVYTLQKLDAAEDRIEAKLDAAEDKLEMQLQNAVTPAQAAATPQPVAPEAPPAAEESSQSLSKEQAQQIALDYLGFSSDQVTRQHAKHEIDDGIPQFDIEIHQGDWEYEFEIHAENGQIISFDKDHKYD